MIARREASGFVVGPSDVRAEKDRLNPYVVALDLAAKNCQLSQATRDGWEAWRAGWEKFYAADEGWLTAGAEMDRVQAYEADVKKWQATIARECPSVAQTPTPAPLGAPQQQAAAGIASSAATIAVALAIIAAIVYLGPLARDLTPRRARR